MKRATVRDNFERSLPQKKKSHRSLVLTAKMVSEKKFAYATDK
jgi:hypothetical protein